MLSMSLREGVNYIMFIHNIMLPALGMRKPYHYSAVALPGVVSSAEGAK